MDHKISALPGGAPLKDTYSDWLPDVALRVDVMMLEQVEALEDKVANASMQVKVSASTLIVMNLSLVHESVNEDCAVSSFFLENLP
jgi:hypothetical protein